MRRRKRRAGAEEERRKPFAKRRCKTAQEFYAKSDPENVARLRMKLIQAGYMDPRAVGTFFLIRFGASLPAARSARSCRKIGWRARKPPL